MYPSYIILDSKLCKFLFEILCIFLVFFLFLFGKTTSIYAETSVYRSAGWVATDGLPAYSSTIGCQVSNDGIYCSRPGANSYGFLYFGSFGQLEDFGIPIDSKIDKIYIRVKGKNTVSQTVSVASGYNKKPFNSSCQIPSDLWQIFLGALDKTLELQTLTSGNGLANCITANNINFRNLTFVLSAYHVSGWSADLDNF